MTTSHFRHTTYLLPCIAALAACSLTLPSEDELFPAGGAAGSGGLPAGSSAGGASGGSRGGALGTSGEGGGAGEGAAPPGLEAGAAGAAGGGGDGGDGGAAGSASGEPPGEAGSGGGPIELPPAVLLLHYTFDDLSQSVVEDASDNGLNGTLRGMSLPTGAAGRIDGALALIGAQRQYVEMPTGVLEGHEAVSITSWLRLSQALAWDRLFDFNSGESSWFFFSPTGWNSITTTFGTRCATRTTAALAPEIMLMETVPINSWHHIAVVFAQPYLRYYLDGQLKSQVDEMSFSSAELGATTQNWIGRSVYQADPYLSALVDDFRIYGGALTAEQIAELAAE